MFLQVGEHFKLFTTSFTFPRIGVMDNNLMVVVVGITAKLFVAQITIVEDGILLVTHQFAMSRKFFTADIALFSIDVVHCSLMPIVIDQLTKLFITNVAIVIHRILLVTLQSLTSRKFIATDFAGCRIYVVHRSLMMIVIDQLAKLFVTNITVVVRRFLLMT